MAWETRHVKIPALNDSQYIGVSVYSVVITSGIVVVLANLISERVTLAFITITALILTSTTATLCLLFIPKLHDIWARSKFALVVKKKQRKKENCKEKISNGGFFKNNKKSKTEMKIDSGNSFKLFSNLFKYNIINSAYYFFIFYSFLWSIFFLLCFCFCAAANR